MPTFEFRDDFLKDHGSNKACQLNKYQSLPILV
jgi:hypothetical protein